ncbi:MAG: RluA family pseudouridine synthase [Thermodesulfobacteriota bacterium]|nr:RluA family pseudouridine synthase [Thermodesulfobacteriota bacterium]
MSQNKYSPHNHSEQKCFIILVGEQDSGKRLDIVVASRTSNCSRSLSASLIRKGKILVQGTIKKPGYLVKTKDEIRGAIPLAESIQYKPEPFEIDILFEDKDIIVINKQAGIVVHPAPGHYTGTLVNRLLYHCRMLEGVGEKSRPGIVHRLDKDTSGVLLVAKNEVSYNSLTAQFKSRMIKKDYLALVHEKFESDSGKISFPIGRHPVDRKRMSNITRKGRSAETLWKVVERFHNITLLELNLKTGRTHQIRVHCAAINHPVVGDRVYGRCKTIKNINKAIPRQMLHAWRLELTHPATKERISFEAPIPQDMSDLIKTLRAKN